jgi:hypothetical protein
MPRQWFKCWLDLLDQEFEWRTQLPEVAVGRGKAPWAVDRRRVIPE